MKKQNLIYLFGIIILVIFATVGYWALNNNNNKQTEKNTQSQQSIVDSNSNRVISYKGKDGVSALDLLKENATVITSGEDESAFVTSINGVAAKSNEFWQLDINGEPAMVGAGSYITKSSETINWKLTTY